MWLRWADFGLYWTVARVCVIPALTKQRFSLNCVGTSIWLSEDTNWLRGGWINTRPRHMVNDALIPGVPALSRLDVWQWGHVVAAHNEHINTSAPSPVRTPLRHFPTGRFWRMTHCLWGFPQKWVITQLKTKCLIITVTTKERLISS